MADTVTTRILANGPRNLVLHFTNFSDGTGETTVTKVDATSATYAYKGISPGVYLSVKRIFGNIRSGGVRLFWDASTDEDMAILNGDAIDLDWTREGGRRTPAIAGATGSIILTTVGFMLNSGYDLTLEMTKGVPQV